MTIRNNIRKIRKDRKITQIQLAKMLGITSSIDRISKWERGFTYPHVKNLLKMMKLFKVSAEEMYPEE